MITADSDDFDALFESVKRDESARLAESHFARDCLWIVEHAQQSPDYLPGIAALVLLSIQQPFYLMPVYVPDVARRGLQSVYLFGHKRAGFEYVRDCKRDLWRVARACHAREISLDDLILAYLDIPGLGVVKASFLAQMTVGDGACLDTLNLRAMGLAESAFETPKTLREKSLRKRIATYNAAWRSWGDSLYWWGLVVRSFGRTNPQRSRLSHWNLYRRSSGIGTAPIGNNGRNHIGKISALILLGIEAGGLYIVWLILSHT